VTWFVEKGAGVIAYAAKMKEAYLVIDSKVVEVQGGKRTYLVVVDARGVTQDVDPSVFIKNYVIVVKP
jgi:hypothetical protein